MTTPRKPGRKAAKNETAAGLLNALAFCGVLKAPTTTSLPSAFHVWMNSGYAIAHNGIVAAGHPISENVNGYPNTKLLAEALANCGKDFILTVRETGAFEIQSGTYYSLVPSLDYAQVIPTPPDAKLYPLNPNFVKCMEAAGKVVSDAATKLLFASVRLNGQTVMSTDGVTIVEAWHGNNMPEGMILPKEFVTALVKTGKEPEGFGVAPDLGSFTVWFADGSWLRTNAYKEVAWPAEFLAMFPTLFNLTPVPMDPKVLTAVGTVLPFADEQHNKRVIIRTGLVRTDPDRRLGAAIELAEANFTLDVDGKRLMAVADHIQTFGLGSLPTGVPTFVFFGQAPAIRGVIVALPPLPEPVVAPTVAASTGWTTTPEPVQQAAPVPAGPSWGVPATAAPAPNPAQVAGLAPAPAFSMAQVAPQPEPQTQPQYASHQVAQPQGEWVGGPPAGLANDPEFVGGAAGPLNFGGPVVAEDDDEEDEAEFNGFGGWLESLPADTGE